MHELREEVAEDPGAGANVKNDSLGDRAKRYEAAGKQFLVPRVPVLARIDGRAFHTFTRGLAKPYDADFHACMWAAATAVCADIAGCKLAYVQSDEINLLLTDYETIGSQAHFDYEVPKLTSTAAATASVAFLLEYLQRFPDRGERLRTVRKNPPTFDARFYNVPREDVSNIFLWRQRDAERNSLTMHAQAHYSHTQLHGKTRGERLDMLHAKGEDWNQLPTQRKRGVCIIRRQHEVNGATRSRWEPDLDIPIFSSPEGRRYIDQFTWPWREDGDGQERV